MASSIATHLTHVSTVLLTLTASAHAYEQVTLAHTWSENHPVGFGAEAFADSVAQNAHGEVEVVIYPEGALYQRYAEMLQGLRLGIIQLAILPVNNLEDFSPYIGFFNDPFVFDSWDEVVAAEREDIGRDALEELESHGLAGLNYINAGTWNLAVNREITTAHDLRGLSVGLQSPEDAQSESVLEDLGSHVERTQPSGALIGQTGRVLDVIELPIPAMDPSWLFNSNLDHIALTQHKPRVFAMVANLDWFRGLPEDIQNIMMQAAWAAEEASTTYSANQADEMLQALKSRGLQVNQIDIRPWEYDVNPRPCKSGYKACKKDNKCGCIKAEECTSC